MTKIGTPLSPTATTVLLCGAGELGKEVAIELQRLGVEVVAIDRYPYAPAMQVAHRSHVVSMLDGSELRRVIEEEKPDLIVPEIEAINTEVLKELEEEGYRVVPSAKATNITMNRENIRKLASEELGLKTSPYTFVSDKDTFIDAVQSIGMPCVVKPIMSSSGKGQSVVRSLADLDSAWELAQTGGRTGEGKLIIEGFVEFDYEITLLTVRHSDGKGGTTTSFCEPIGHRQEGGDYKESWQPHPMSPELLVKSQEMAIEITEALGGWGVFGVELFINGDEVFFSEVSPRPHDTGMVTMISQNLSEFALHALAILGFPIPSIRQLGPSASSVIMAEGESNQVVFANLAEAMSLPDTQLRLFGKPEVKGQRRMGVTLALGATLEEGREKASAASSQVIINL
ncbi:MAG: phosphoribosylglycinamide formyltransferase 2 [Chlamydiales bacterium]|jgi:phosphoribosylglycinamide formyltransferase 2